MAWRQGQLNTSSAKFICCLAIFWPISQVKAISCDDETDTLIQNLSDLANGQEVRFTSHSDYDLGLPYPASYQCNYEFLLGDHCDRMKLACDSMDIYGNYSESCANGDFLWFNDNFHTFHEKTCGQQQVSYYSDGPALFARFVSNSSQQANGFECYAKCVPAGEGLAGGGDGEAGNDDDDDDDEVGDATSKSTTTTSPAPRCTCGLVNRKQRIIGGQVTEANEYPWQAALVVHGHSNPYCGGSLIDSQWVMTAAHCTAGFSASHIQVVLGEHDHTRDNETDHMVVDVIEIHDHPAYDGWMVSDDFSLLKLAQAIDFQRHGHILPVCLPTEPAPPPGATVTATGWGATREGGGISDTLNEVDIKLFSYERCQGFLGANQLTPHMFCAGLAKGGKDSCQGDSGGPLVSRKGPIHELIGVTSWGFGCGRKKYPGVYAHVLKVKDWWSEIIGEDLECTNVL